MTCFAVVFAKCPYSCIPNSREWFILNPLIVDFVLFGRLSFVSINSNYIYIYIYILLKLEDVC